ncbi:hypothetical protein [Streptomyces chattanoogensis]|uniref:hypothetical protein n=1 Tax=Streptomyces chattanoogensis TaxID=66876 RepID=UPI0006B4F04A|nr:hypothetical protein [Streptomyces chattanoogensis]
MKHENSRHGGRGPLLRRGVVTAVATTALFGAGLAGFAGTAAAAPQPSAQAQAQARVPAVHAAGSDVSTTASGWTFYRAYWTGSACKSEGKRGKSKGWWSDYSCNYDRGNDGKMKWFLYVYNRVGG